MADVNDIVNQVLNALSKAGGKKAGGKKVAPPRRRGGKAPRTRIQQFRDRERRSFMDNYQYDSEMGMKRDVPPVGGQYRSWNKAVKIQADIDRKTGGKKYRRRPSRLEFKSPNRSVKPKPRRKGI